MSDREFDVVVLGASGFAGSLVAQHLASAAGPEVRVALAGRSRARLDAVRDALPGHARGWDLITLDATDEVGLRRLASRTTALATTVGPYDRDGRQVVLAAAEGGTHYADLTGELGFVRWSLDVVDPIARRTGARVVHSCGFDSIPSDLGVLLAAERAAADGQGTLAETTLRVVALKGGFSGGTIDSARQQALAVREDPALRRLLADPYALSPRRGEEPPTPPRDGGRLVPVERDPESGHWLGPFIMAGYNTRVVRLSNALMGWAYGRGLRYREVADLGAGPRGLIRGTALALGMRAGAAGLGWAPTRAVLDRLLPEPGEGPSPEQRAAGLFRMEITATTNTGARYRTTVAADLDPGYDATAVMLGQSALCLAFDEGTLPFRTGVLTPATAMGGVLADRLRNQGFTFAVQRVA